MHWPSSLGLPSVLLFKCVFMALFFTCACETIMRSLSGLDLQFLFKASQMKWVFNHAVMWSVEWSKLRKQSRGMMNLN